MATQNVKCRNCGFKTRRASLKRDDGSEFGMCTMCDVENMGYRGASNNVAKPSKSDESNKTDVLDVDGNLWVEVESNKEYTIFESFADPEIVCVEANDGTWCITGFPRKTVIDNLHFFTSSGDKTKKTFGG